MVLLRREHGYFIFSCFRPLRPLPSSFLSLHVLEHAFIISADPIDDTGWTGRLYWCNCGHGYPNVVRALRPHVMVVDDWRHASRRWFGIVVSIHSSGKMARLPYNFAYREAVKATYMSSLAAYVCDDMASISRQPCMLLVSFKLTGTTRVPRKSSLYYNIVSMCAGVYLQGPLGFFKFFELFASIARSRSRSPNDIVSANSCSTEHLALP